MRYLISVIFLSFCCATWAQQNDSLSKSIADSVQLREAVIGHLHTSVAIQIDTNMIGYKRGPELAALALRTAVFDDLGKILAQQPGVFLRENGLSGSSVVSIKGLSANHTQLLWNGLYAGSPTLGVSDFGLQEPLFYPSIQLQTSEENLGTSSGGLGGTISLKTNALKPDSLSAKGFVQFGSLGSSRFFGQATTTRHNFATSTKLTRYHSANDFEYTNPARTPNTIERRIGSERTRIGLQQNVSITKWPVLRIHYAGEVLESNVKLPGNILRETPNNAEQSDLNIRQSLLFEFGKKYRNHKLALGHLFDQQHYTDNGKQIYNSQNWQARYSTRRLFGETVADLTAHGQYIIGYGNGFAGRKTQWRPELALSLRRKGFYSWAGDVRWVASEDKQNFAARFGQQMDYRKFRFKLNASTNFRLPTLNELYWREGGNQDLKSERSYTAEGNIKWVNSIYNFGGYRFSQDFTIAGLYGLVNDWILWKPTRSENFWSPVNIRQVDRMGGSFTAVFRLFNSKNYHKLELNVAHYKSIDKALNEQLILTPERTATASFYMRRGKWFGQYFYRFADTRWIDESYSAYMPYYMLSDVSVGYRILEVKKGMKIDLEIGVRNLLDKQYQVQPWMPMPGRNYTIKLNIAFKKPEARTFQTAIIHD